MAYNVQARSGKFQLRVTHKLLPKPYFYTFDQEQEAENYGLQLNTLLGRGVVPAELLGQKSTADDLLFFQVGTSYEEAVGGAPSDKDTFKRLYHDHKGLRVSDITIAWSELWVRKMKIQDHLAPSTIRKRVGLMARIMDWHYRRSTPSDKVPPANPLRMLPKNYSSVNPLERKAMVEKGIEVKKDKVRDRRLSAEEEESIRDVLSGKKRPDRQRPHAVSKDPMFCLLFDFILHTGCRLTEAMWQRKEKIDMKSCIIHVDGSKGWYGAIKPRTVPMKPELEKLLEPHVDGTGYLFPFWDGDPATRDKSSRALSKKFRTLFDYAGIEDLTEHDLRHEATCRWISLRNKSGNWMFSDTEVCRLMGWTDTRMLLRYASLRGSDLAQRLRE